MSVLNPREARIVNDSRDQRLDGRSVAERKPRCSDCGSTVDTKHRVGCYWLTEGSGVVPWPVEF